MNGPSSASFTSWSRRSTRYARRCWPASCRPMTSMPGCARSRRPWTSAGTCCAGAAPGRAGRGVPPVSRAIVVEAYGGPEVLMPRDREPPAPGPGEVVVDVTASGVNYIDVYHRMGRYPNPLPFTPGVEGTGTVLAVGSGVTELRPGDRVGWASGLGSYAEQAVIPASQAVPLPDGLAEETAAAALLQGMTAHYLVHDSYPVEPGDMVLVHAAAGGMGLLLTQLVKHLGGTVIGTASSDDKRREASEAGADLVVGYAEVLDAVSELTGGAGVAAVYDGVGKDTFETSLASLRRRGSFVSYGSASGLVQPADAGTLRRGAPRAAPPRQRRLRLGVQRCPHHPHRSAVSAVRRRTGAPGPRRPPYDRKAAAAAVGSTRTW